MSFDVDRVSEVTKRRRSWFEVPSRYFGMASLVVVTVFCFMIRRDIDVLFNLPPLLSAWAAWCPFDGRLRCGTAEPCDDVDGAGAFWAPTKTKWPFMRATCVLRTGWCESVFVCAAGCGDWRRDYADAFGRHRGDRSGLAMALYTLGYAAILSEVFVRRRRLNWNAVLFVGRYHGRADATKTRGAIP